MIGAGFGGAFLPALANEHWVAGATGAMAGMTVAAGIQNDGTLTGYQVTIEALGGTPGACSASGPKPWPVRSWMRATFVSTAGSASS